MLLSSTDATVSDTHTYTFASGAGDDDNAEFTIDGDKLKSNKVFDYNDKEVYKIRVRSTDGTGLYVEKAFSIGIDEIPMTLNTVRVNDLDYNYHTGTFIEGIGNTATGVKNVKLFINNLQKGVTL